MNILIVKLSALGDVVQTLPAFEALRNHYPGAHISWLVEEGASELLEYYPGLDEICVCQRKSWLKRLRQPLFWPAVCLDIIRFSRRLRSRYYDLILDFQGLLKSAIWVGLARGGRKIGFEGTREGSWMFLNERLPPYDPDRHALDRYLDLARYLGAEVGSVLVRDPWTPAEEHHFSNRLSQVTRNGESSLIVCHSVSRWQTKLWPEAKFAKLATEMVERLRATIVFTGSAEDRGQIAALMDEAGGGGLYNWAGETNLRELAYLCKRAGVVISTDSGPMHLAAVLGTPVVALFGPTAPWRTGPYGNVHRVLRMDRDCSPCFQRSCEAVECMAAIEVNDVYQAVIEQLRKE
jgi:lipopolysaccharide heptosyltransferase I